MELKTKAMEGRGLFQNNDSRLQISQVGKVDLGVRRQAQRDSALDFLNISAAQTKAESRCACLRTPRSTFPCEIIQLAPVADKNKRGPVERGAVFFPGDHCELRIAHRTGR